MLVCSLFVSNELGGSVCSSWTLLKVRMLFNLPGTAYSFEVAVSPYDIHMYKVSTESCKSLSAACVYPSRYQITVFVCVKRLMFQLFKLRAGSHSKARIILRVTS